MKEKKENKIDYKILETISKVEELKKITDNLKISTSQYNSITRA